jgi:hypothetical protein
MTDISTLAYKIKNEGKLLYAKPKVNAVKLSIPQR